MSDVVDDAGYPREALGELIRRSEEQFLAHLAEHPEGDNWSAMWPSTLLATARTHLDRAEGCAAKGDTAEATKQAAHATNFVLFALDAMGDEDGDSA